MEAWWSALSNSEKLLWLIATFSSVLFGLQIVSTFLGMSDSDMDMDADFDMDGDVDVGGDMDAAVDGDGDAVHDAHAGHWIAGYFTVRNFVAFFLGLSWGSLAFISSGLPNAAAIFMGMGIGVFFVIVVMFLMKALSNLRSEGTISLRSAVGTEGDVSILIPGNNQGSGKVTLTVQGRLMEIEAITEGEELRRSDRIRVVNVSQHQLVVEKVQ
jgi:membrane protein implicated in regulation of membrane protease activity